MESYRFASLVTLVSTFAAPFAFAWDYEGHRMVNQLALAAMPAGFAPFTREAEAAERIAFLSGEPDRWRNNRDSPVKHACGLEHYFDFEDLATAGLDPKKIPDTRFSFATVFAAGRFAHASDFPAINADKNADNTAEWPGFAPWTITEYYGKLKSTFTTLKTFEAAGTPEEVANARANAIYLMGIMGHYVGDCSQPLHLTVHHNGWVGENPKEYTRWSGFHAWIDGGYMDKVEISTESLKPRVEPAKPIDLKPAAKNGQDPMFSAVMDYVIAEHEFVEPIYALEKAGAFKEENIGKSNAGKAFIEDRLLTGSRMLASIWLTAWNSTGEDEFLKARLEKRKKAAEPTPAPTPSAGPAPSAQ